METYKQVLDLSGSVSTEMVQRVSDTAFIPCDLGNSDYQQFKADAAAGCTIQDSTGATLSQAAADAFVAGLP